MLQGAVSLLPASVMLFTILIRICVWVGRGLQDCQPTTAYQRVCLDDTIAIIVPPANQAEMEETRVRFQTRCLSQQRGVLERDGGNARTMRNIHLDLYNTLLVL